MDLITKNLITKASAYNSAFVEVWQESNNDTDVEYSEGSDINGTFVRAYLEGVGWSSKYYYA